MLKLTMTAAIATLLMMPSAFALPVQKSSGTDAGLIQHVQHRDQHRDRAQHRDRDHRYEPGSRVRHAPRGWHRHNARPRDWRDRGCILVGPIWFCP